MCSIVYSSLYFFRVLDGLSNVPALYPLIKLLCENDHCQCVSVSVLLSTVLRVLSVSPQYELLFFLCLKI